MCVCVVFVLRHTQPGGRRRGAEVGDGVCEVAEEEKECS